jgi:hypothetical protein
MLETNQFIAESTNIVSYILIAFFSYQAMKVN